jgi:hypothetical protein
MSDDELQRDVLDHVGIDRRAFVRRVVLGSAFAVPVVGSWSMKALANPVPTKPPAGANQTSGNPLPPVLANRLTDPSGTTLIALTAKPVIAPKARRVKFTGTAIVGGPGSVLAELRKAGLPTQLTYTWNPHKFALRGAATVGLKVTNRQGTTADVTLVVHYAGLRQTS